MNGRLKQSILDHVYTNDSTVVSKISPLEVMIGDHSVILFDIAGTVEAPDPVFRRNWKTYTPKKLVD